MVSEIFRTLVGPGNASGQPLSPGFQIPNFFAKLFINSDHIKIRTIPTVVSEK